MAVLTVDYSHFWSGLLGGHNPLNFARNGITPSGHGMARLAGYINYLNAGRTKTLFHKSIQPADALTNTAADTTVWRFACHTGPLASKVRLVMVLVPANSPDQTANPRAYWTMETGLTGSGVVTTHPTIFYSGVDTSIVPNDYVMREQEVTVTADTDYRWSLHLVQELSCISVTAYEVPRLTLDTSTDTNAVDSTKYAYGLRTVHDANALDLIGAVDKLWRRNQPPLFTWSVPDGTAYTRTGTNVNLLDSSVTARSATSPGFITWPRYRHSFDSTNVGVVYYAHARVSAGTGEISFVDANGTNKITVTDTTAAGIGHSATASLVGTDASNKIDVLINCTGGTLSVWAVGAIYYVA